MLLSLREQQHLEKSIVSEKGLTQSSSYKKKINNFDKMLFLLLSKTFQRQETRFLLKLERLYFTFYQKVFLLESK